MKTGKLANGNTVHILSTNKNGKLYPHCIGLRKNTLCWAHETKEEVTCKRCQKYISKLNK